MTEFFAGMFFGAFFLAIAPEGVRNKFVNYFNLRYKYVLKQEFEAGKKGDKK